MLVSPHIIISFTGVVWRMEIDESSDIICLEVRNVEGRSVFFCAVDLNNGQVYFSDLNLPSAWQSGLAAAANGVVLINGYQSEVLPVSKGLTAIDIKTGKALWANYNLNLENVQSLGLEVYDVRFQPKKITLVNAATGLPISGGSDSNKIRHQHIIYPQQIDPALLLTYRGLPVAVEGSALFLKHNGYRILSLHALKDRVLSQQLFVYNGNGDLVFEDIIASDIQKLQPEAFIVYKNKLIWLQNRSVLKVLDL